MTPNVGQPPSAVRTDDSRGRLSHKKEAAQFVFSPCQTALVGNGPAQDLPCQPGRREPDASLSGECHHRRSEDPVEPTIARGDPQHIVKNAVDRLVPGTGGLPRPGEAVAEALPRESGRVRNIDDLSLLDKLPGHQRIGVRRHSPAPSPRPSGRAAAWRRPVLVPRGK